jgi:hypothetical protein
MHKKPVKYLVLIEADGSMVARLFDADRVHVSDIDASSEEVAVMTKGLVPTRDADTAAWQKSLAGDGAPQRAQAQVYTLDV